MNQKHSDGINTVAVSTLDDLLAALKKIREANHGYDKFDVFYRGQACEEWDLDATIYREHGKGILFDFYFELTWHIRHEIEAMLNVDFNLSEIDRIAMIRYLTGESDTVPGSAMRYLITLRHYGFPSPLLDWTKSTGVALHFAAGGPHKMKADLHKKDRGAVYILVVPNEVSQIKVDGDAVITIHQAPIRTDRRHFRQQATYTTTNWAQKNSKGQVIANHFANQRVALTKGHKEGKCELWKVVFDKGLIPEILSYCDENNINDFTLFDNTEGLMKTLRNRHFVIDPTGRLSGRIDCSPAEQ